MKTNLMKLLVILAAMTFFGAGAAMAKDRYGDRKHRPPDKTAVHTKVDRHHTYGNGRHYKNHASPRHYGHHYGPRHYKKYYASKYYYKHHKKRYYPHRHYHGAGGYSAYNSFSVGLAVCDPNVAFSIGVNGR
jgi:hypothetical protein